MQLTESAVVGRCFEDGRHRDSQGVILRAMNGAHVRGALNPEKRRVGDMFALGHPSKEECARECAGFKYLLREMC